MIIKNVKLIIFFIVGIIAVFALISTRAYFKTIIAHGDTSKNLIVFDDQLASQFSNWSWNSSVNLSNTSPVYSGTTSISFTPAAWGGLYFHTPTPLSITSYNALQFAMNTSDSPNNFTLLFYDGNNQPVKSINLSQYPGVSQNGWIVYTIPTANMPAMLGGFSLQESSGNPGPTTFIDDIHFVAPVVSTSGITANQTSFLYADTLASGWVNWSWNSTVNFATVSPVYQGSHAISFTPTAGFGGLYIHSDQGIDTTPYQTLTFTAQATVSGQTYVVGVYDANNQLLHSLIPLDGYGGQPSVGSWKVYAIPLSDLNATNKIIKGVMIQDTTGKSGQTVFLDQMGLSGIGLSNQQSQTTTASSSSVPGGVTPSIANSGNPLSSMKFFNDTTTDPAVQQQQQWQSSDPADAAMIGKIASQPKALWIGNWIGNVQSYIQTAMTKAKSSNTVPVLVAYNIPQRDCGGYSAGGTTVAEYQSWIDGFAAGIGSGRAVVIIEPDALSQITCLSQTDQQTRLSLLSYAVKKFKSLGQTAVYLDAGHAGWIAPATMASTLKNAAIDQADGFSLNVSNFMTTTDSISYGQQISSLIGGKHFVIDTSRNGTGSNGDWCNPSGRGLGSRPTTQTGNTLVDAFLWIKYPGESDGTCNGGPAAGSWYSSYALGLAQRAQW